MSDKKVVLPEIKIATTCILIYICIYSFEAPIRYGLYYAGLIQVILLRDLLIMVPLAYIVFRQLVERRLDAPFPLFSFLAVFQGAVFYFNYHTIVPVFLGIKILANTTLGLIVAENLIVGTPKQTRILWILLVTGFAGLVIEKFVTHYPWVGMMTMIGGIEVPISVDWQIADQLTARVGGFTRESINAASLLPFIGLLLVARCRTFFLRFITILLVVASVLLTTQKGALVAILLIAASLMLPTAIRLASLRILVLGGAVLQVVAPFATQGVLISEGTGSVFTASSIAARILYTWPTALAFVFERSLGPFGIGIGGLGGPMRLVGTVTLAQVGDNMFIFLFAYLGVFAAIFYIAVCVSVWRSLVAPVRVIEPALAICAYCLIYGTVITGFEDQVLSLALGLSLGALLRLKSADLSNVPTSSAKQLSASG